MKKVICLVLSMALVLTSLSYAQSTEVNEHLKNLDIGRSFNYRNLTIIPIYARSFKDKTNYVTLDEAVNKGYITIAELEGGRVPQVKIQNNSDFYILLIAGEVLSGCRQDRLVGRDALIGPRSKEIILPVYCSERGRWTSKGEHFYSEGVQAEPVLRGMLYGGTNQSAVWDSIGAYSAKSGVASSTEALQDVYRSPVVKAKIQNYTAHFENIPNLEKDSVGVVVGLGDQIIGIDVFANPNLFSRSWPKLLKSYVSLAINHQDMGGTLTQDKAKRVLNQVYRAGFNRQQGVCLGHDLQASINQMIASALVFRSALIHLGVFPTDENYKQPIIGYQDRMPLIDDRVYRQNIID